MTEPRVKAIPEGMHTITPHIVVWNAARAAEWYAEALGAEERSRIPVPGGKLMSVELWFGDSAVMVADEFPEMGVLSPQSVGGTSTVLNLYTEDVDALWERAVRAGAEVLHPLRGYIRGRPARADQRPLRPPLGASTARARRPARGNHPRRSGGVRWLGFSRAARFTGSSRTKRPAKWG